MEKAEFDKLFFVGDMIYQIPNKDSYWDILEKLRQMGYHVYNCCIDDYSTWPCICYTLDDEGHHISVCREMWIDRQRTIEYSDFIIMIQGSDWKENLSKQFNEKICNQNTTSSGTD